MDDIGYKEKDFVGYEYKEVVTESNKVSLLLDGYENFGWQLDENMAENNLSHGLGNVLVSQQKKVIIRLKRNRKIINKMELTRLQRNFEACINEIEELEKNKTSAATMYALIVGILGTAFMAGSVFAVTATPPYIVLSILLAIPGFIGWILPYFVYKKMGEKQRKKIAPMIEKKYDEIYEICEKGNKLLYH